MISVVRNIHSGGYKLANTTEVVLNALRALQSMPSLAHTTVQKQELMNRLIQAGAPVMVLELITSHYNQIVQETLNLGIDLLEQGLKSVQEVIMSTFIA